LDISDTYKKNPKTKKAELLQKGRGLSEMELKKMAAKIRKLLHASCETRQR